MDSLPPGILDGWVETGICVFLGVFILRIGSESFSSISLVAPPRVGIVTATLGEAMSALRIKDENGKMLMLQEQLIVDVWGKAL